MKQILHIFLKDARHHWPEIVASLALLVAYMVDQPRGWSHQQVVAFRLLAFASKALPVLLVVSWGFLVVRLVQSEALVGDRQFWTTRPYEWPKLLAAKLLSIFVFIHLPLFLAQMVLLAYARFPVMKSIPGLLFVHTGVACTLFLPLIAIAAVTAGIGSACLFILGVIVFIAGIAGVSSVLEDSLASSDASDSMQVIILLASCFGVTLLQYARRKAWPARFWLVGCAALIAILALSTPFTSLIATSFPLPTSDKPLPAQFALDPMLVFAHGARQSLSFSNDEVNVQIPMRVSGLPADTVIEVSGAKLDLEVPGGQRWTSHWRNSYTTLLPGRTRDWPLFAIKRSLFDSVKGKLVKAHVALALNVYKIVRSETIEVKGAGIEIPGGARCKTSQFDGELHCFAALREPGPFLAKADLPSPNCQSQETMSSGRLAEAPAYYANMSKSTEPDFLLSPVSDFSIGISKMRFYEDVSVYPPICSGTSLVFDKPAFSYGTRAEIDLGEVDLLDYVPGFPRTIRQRPLSNMAPRPDHVTLLFDSVPEHGAD